MIFAQYKTPDHGFKLHLLLRLHCGEPKNLYIASNCGKMQLIWSQLQLPSGCGESKYLDVADCNSKPCIRHMCVVSLWYIGDLQPFLLCFKFLLTCTWQKMKTRFPGFVNGTLKINSSSVCVMGQNCSLHFPLLFLQLMFILSSLVNIQI